MGKHGSIKVWIRQYTSSALMACRMTYDRFHCHEKSNYSNQIPYNTVISLSLLSFCLLNSSFIFHNFFVVGFKYVQYLTTLGKRQTHPPDQINPRQMSPSSY